MSEDQFRPVFFDSSKRTCQSNTDLNKRARLDVPTVPSPPASTATSPNDPTSASSSSTPSSQNEVSSHKQDSCATDQDKNSTLKESSNISATVATPSSITVSSKANDINVNANTITNATATTTATATITTAASIANHTHDKITKQSTRNFVRDSSSRFNGLTCHGRRGRSKSLPNLPFAYHRRSRSQPSAAAALEMRVYQAAANTVASRMQRQTKTGGQLSTNTAITATSSTATINNNSSSSSSLKRSHRHYRSHNNLSFNGTDTSVAQLPPVNTQSLREIDLTEILKNPQLRHDILFDPQLQFRPNLDGERGRRKKQVVDKYWTEVEEECKECMQLSSKLNGNASNNITTTGSSLVTSLSKFHLKYSKLPRLFSTLRDILITLLPSKDRAAVYDVMDVDLLVQQLRKGVVDFVSLAKWLANVFKSHCAPMRDAWVDEMTEKFVEADQECSIKKLIEGLRMIFSILEAMKLDVANHQIRVLRPALVETAVDFERDYFTQMIARRNMSIKDSLLWFCGSVQTHFDKEMGTIAQEDFINAPNCLRNISINAIVKLLSCREMVSDFPSSLSFDHLRLILLRADVRQLVCLQICLYLYKQLVATYNKDAVKRSRLLTKGCLNDVKREILAVITDENGNVKWTRNIPSIAVQLAKRATMDLSASSLSNNLATPPESIVNFAHSWLLKQTQPRSDVYGLMEERIFNQLISQVMILLDNSNSKNGGASIQSTQIPKTVTGNSLSASSPTSALANANNSGPSTPISGSGTVPVTPTSSSFAKNNATNNGQLAEEISSLAGRLSVLANFHWSVFGTHYTEAVKNLELDE